MALPAVNIEIQNGGVGGAIGTTDQTAGLILQGIAATGLTLNTAKAIYSVNDAVALGIDEAYDTANTTNVYKQISQFYAEAGAGKKLWIMIVAQTETLTDICDQDGSAPRLNDLIDAANGEIRIVGVSRSAAGGYSPTVTNGIDADVETAIVNAQGTADHFEALFKPFVCVLDGYAYNGTADDLTDLTGSSQHSVAVNLLKTTSAGSSTAVGLVLGRLAKIPVQRSIGRVADGALSETTLYLATTEVSTISDGELGTAYDKAYIVGRKFTNKNGVFYAGDVSATATTDDYFGLARNRTMNKAITLAYSTYIEDLNDEVAVNADGTIVIGSAKHYETKIENAINESMTANGEISNVSAFVDPNQNIVSTSQLVVEVDIQPVAINKNIKVKLGFAATV